MNVTIVSQEQCKRQLRLEIPGDEVRAETDRVAGTLARKINVPGFRRGRVPKSLVKTRFRKELRDEVIGQLLPSALNDAIRSKELKVVGEPSLDDLKFRDDETIDVTFTVEVAPEFELGNYKDIPLIKRVYKIKDEEIDTAVKELQERHAELVPVESGAAQAGDIVSVDLIGHELAGEGAELGTPDAVEGRDPESKPHEVKQDNVDIELGASGVIKEFTEELTGCRAGDRRTVTVDYPEDYSSAELAGKRFKYELEVTAVRRKELPELSDEFARSVDADLDSIEALRADIQARYAREATARSEHELRNSATEQLVDRNRFDVPEYVVEQRLNSKLSGLIRQIASQGIDPQQMKVDWKQLRESQRGHAEQEVRGTFILDRIADLEGIEVSEQEIDEEIERIAGGANQSAASVKARLTKENSLDSIREQVRRRKALDSVITSASIRVEEVEGLGAPTREDG